MAKAKRDQGLRADFLVRTAQQSITTPEGVMTPIPGVKRVAKAKRKKRPKEQPVRVWEWLLAPMLLSIVLIAARLIGPEGLIAGGVFMVCAAIMFGTITGRSLPGLKATKLLITVISQYRRGRR